MKSNLHCSISLLVATVGPQLTSFKIVIFNSKIFEMQFSISCWKVQSYKVMQTYSHAWCLHFASCLTLHDIVFLLTTELGFVHTIKALLTINLVSIQFWPTTSIVKQCLKPHSNWVIEFPHKWLLLPESVTLLKIYLELHGSKLTTNWPYTWMRLDFGCAPKK